MTGNQPSPYGESPYQAPVYPGAGGAPRRSGGSGRPGTLTAAAVLTYLGAAAVFCLALLMFIALLSTAILRDAVSAADFGGLSLGEARIMFGCVGAGLVVFGVALIALAVHAARGRGGARIALTVLGAVFVVMFGLAALSSPGFIVPVLYVGLVVVLLWVGGANAWFRAQKAARKAAASRIS